MKREKIFLKLLPLFVYLLLWEIFSVCVGDSLLFPTPAAVGKRFLQLLSEGEFYIFSFNTCKKVMTGFFSALFMGSLSAFLAYKSRLFESFLKIPVMLMKAVPVAAYIIMLFMLLPSSEIPAVISFIAVFPIVYSNLFDSLLKRDRNIYEMADVFEIKGLKRFFYISLPESYNSLRTAVRLGIGTAFKASVASEVITISSETIGESFYNAKIYFDMAGLLAWTAGLVLITLIFEKAFLIILNVFEKRLESGLKWI